jgi:hypothetical protein
MTAWEIPYLGTNLRFNAARQSIRRLYESDSDGEAISRGSP